MGCRRPQRRLAEAGLKHRSPDSWFPFSHSIMLHILWLRASTPEDYYQQILCLLSKQRPDPSFLGADNLSWETQCLYKLNNSECPMVSKRVTLRCCWGKKVQNHWSRSSGRMVQGAGRGINSKQNQMDAIVITLEHDHKAGTRSQWEIWKGWGSCRLIVPPALEG